MHLATFFSLRYLRIPAAGAVSPSVFVLNATLMQSSALAGVPSGGAFACSEKKVSSPPPIAASSDAKIVEVRMATSIENEASPSTTTGASRFSVVLRRRSSANGSSFSKTTEPSAETALERNDIKRSISMPYPTSGFSPASRRPTISLSSSHVESPLSSSYHQISWSRGICLHSTVLHDCDSHGSDVRTTEYGSETLDSTAAGSPSARRSASRACSTVPSGGSSP
mmetsp:Transcript_8979/g.23143  ORF Transcript_8979/g.23143 Transcript_8979/m.23143 type:complete len:225 (-) Transcript_8979:1518-2192(-)